MRPPQGTRDQQAAAQLILLMRGLRSLAYGLLAVILGVVLADEGFSPAAIGVLITVSLVGDMLGTYGHSHSIWWINRPNLP